MGLARVTFGLVMTRVATRAPGFPPFFFFWRGGGGLQLGFRFSGFLVLWGFYRILGLRVLRALSFLGGAWVVISGVICPLI